MVQFKRTVELQKGTSRWLSTGRPAERPCDTVPQPAHQQHSSQQALVSSMAATKVSNVSGTWSLTLNSNSATITSDLYLGKILHQFSLSLENRPKIRMGWLQRPNSWLAPVSHPFCPPLSQKHTDSAVLPAPHWPRALTYLLPARSFLSSPKAHNRVSLGVLDSCPQAPYHAIKATDKL